MPPEIATRISCSVGSGFSSSSARTVICIPGVQNPHWRACVSWKPCWTGSSLPSTSSDSTVRISWPSHITARVVHALTGWPSISTTHAPQFEVSQPQCVPVSPGVSRMKCTSSWRGSTSRETASPLIEMVTCIFQASWCCARARAAESAFRQNAREVALVVHGPAAIRKRGAVLGGDLARLREQLLRRRPAAKQLLGAGDVDGRRPYSAERHTGVRDRAVLDPDRGRCGRDRPVAGPPLDLLVGAARAH